MYLGDLAEPRQYRISQIMNPHNQAERALHNMVAVSSTETVCMQADADAERLAHIMSDDRKDAMKSN